MRYLLAIGLVSAAMLAGCRSRDVQAHEDQRQKPDPVVDTRPPQNPDSLAYKAGKAAHDVAKETGKAAREAGRKLDEAARNASEGWKEGAREDRAKQQPPAK
jgi:hypothetical protein